MTLDLGIIDFSHDEFLVWAEPDEGSYNYKMYKLGSRYTKEENIIPPYIKNHIKNNASKYYPIMIVDGYHIDSVLDYLSVNKSPHIQAFGQHPRVITGKSDDDFDSIEDFERKFK